MGEFRFKQFSVRNEAAAQKVGTDAVLLGAAMTLSNPKQLLDIGTGTGVIALMAAQRLACNSQDFSILGIDIDPAAAAEAAENFARSPWTRQLRAENIPLAELTEGSFDCIFSNPPYFEDSLRAPDERRSNARHTDTLSYREICAFAAEQLKPGGSLSLILPAAEKTPLLRYAASFGLKAFRILNIRSTARKPVSRIIAEFRQGPCEQKEEELILMDGPSRSGAYSAMTSDFYLDA